MRAGTNKKSWISGDCGTIIGISLGFDFCHEHEIGVNRLHELLGVPAMETPIGIADRKISKCPDRLEFVEYEVKPKDKRRKTGTPAASLILTHRGSYRDMTDEELRTSLGLNFYTDVHDKWHKPEFDDMICSWSHEKFGINVRGPDNVNHLRKIYEAFKRHDIALAHPSSRGFLRTGLSFVIASRVPSDAEEAVRTQDLAEQRLVVAAKATGVVEMLEAAGLRYYALAPGWNHGDQEDDVVFFLNPEKQDKFNHGWFSVDELQEWALGKGPIIKDEALTAFGKSHVDWDYNLVSGLRERGIFLRRHSHLVWLDSNKASVGVKVHPARQSEEILPEGVYQFDELVAKFTPSKRDTSTEAVA